PTFTKRELDARGVGDQLRVWSLVERGAFWSMGLVVVAELSLAPPRIMATLLMMAALFQVIRLLGWSPHRCLRQPLVWVLHGAYLFLAAGLALRALALWSDLLPQATALHMLTIGAFGMALAGIMTRVSLAHTGRPPIPGRIFVSVYLLLALAALLRVGLAEALPLWANRLSGVLWLVCFTLILLRLVPILTQARVDGRPG
ncbi:MAG: NnrS family protein, partial [Magnetococcales bacterium]|nr:NnrS family protein [Magnetococcales bacterium]